MSVMLSKVKTCIIIFLVRFVIFVLMKNLGQAQNLLTNLIRHKTIINGFIEPNSHLAILRLRLK